MEQIALLVPRGVVGVERKKTRFCVDIDKANEEQYYSSAQNEPMIRLYWFEQLMRVIEYSCNCYLFIFNGTCKLASSFHVVLLSLFCYYLKLSHGFMFRKKKCT